jgi:hypothetical protein
MIQWARASLLGAMACICSSVLIGNQVIEADDKDGGSVLPAIGMIKRDAEATIQPTHCSLPFLSRFDSETYYRSGLFPGQLLRVKYHFDGSDSRVTSCSLFPDDSKTRVPFLYRLPR